jgi:hypothetical protein
MNEFIHHETSGTYPPDSSEAGMLVGVRDIPNFQAKVVLQVYNFILSWPCPACRKTFPCTCDEVEAKSTKCAILQYDTAPVLEAPAQLSQSDTTGAGPQAV